MMLDKLDKMLLKEPIVSMKLVSDDLLHLYQKIKRMMSMVMKNKKKSRKKNHKESSQYMTI